MKLTILEMLQRRCGFEAAPPQPRTVDMGHLPESVQNFFRQADGGRGWLRAEEREDAPDLLLFGQGELDAMKTEFLETVKEEFHCWVLLCSREVSPGEKARLASVGESLAVLGQCDDPERPDYLCCYGSRFFLADGNRLEELLREGPPREGTEDYMAFLDQVLRKMELDRLDYSEYEITENEK